MNNTQTSNKQAWLIIITAGLFFCFIFAQIGMFNTLTSFLMHDFNISSTQYGQLSAYYFYGNLLFLIPAGILLDRISTVKILATASLIATIATYGFANTDSLFSAQMLRLLTGIAGSFALLTVLKLATKWFNSDKLALVIGVTVTLAMLGGMLAQTPFVWMIDNYGWRQTLVYNSIVGAIITVLISLIVKNKPKSEDKCAKEESSQPISAVFKCLKLAISNRQNWLGGISISLLNLPIFIFGATWGSIYLKQAYNLTSYQASYIVSMIFIGMIVGSPLSGWLSDNYSITFNKGIKLMNKGSRRQPLILSALISTICILILITATHLSYYQLIVLFFAIGMFSSLQVCGYPLITENNPSHLTASASSIASMLIMAGGFILPIFGWLVSLPGDSILINHEIIYSTHDFNLAMSILPISYIIAGLAAYHAKETI